SWFHSGSDFERPLEERGKQDAKRTGEILNEKGFRPDLILTSPAKRTLDTALFVATKLNYPQKNIVVDQNLYDASIEDLISTLQKLESLHDSVILVGHNPGLTWLANYLAEDHVASLPTSGMYCIEFNTNNWQEITLVEGKTLFVEVP